MGLLSRASLISTERKLAFSEFIIKHGIKIFGIFEKKDNFYSIVNSIGFDGASLLSSVSTEDFWNGIFTDNEEIKNFDCTNKSLNPMLQFFSFDLIDNIKSVSVYKKNDNIFMLSNMEYNQNIIQDINNLDYSIDYIDLNEFNKNITNNSQVFKFQLDFTEAVSGYLAIKARNVDNKEDLEKALVNELSNRFSCFLCKYGTKKLNNNSLKLIINLDKSIQEEHFICHLVYNLKKVLSNSAEMISFTNNGIADSMNEIKDFLQVE